MTPDMYRDTIRYLRKSLKFHKIAIAILAIVLAAVSIITISLLL